MTTIDTRLTTQYSQLIPAMHALCTAPAGSELQIVMCDPAAFADFKAYLVERGIGFREIYDADATTLSFTL
jgi:hypothetical protein